MKLLFVTPGMAYGGAERVITILSNSWSKMGHKVEILIISDKNHCVYNLDSNVTVINIGGLPKCSFPHLKLVSLMRNEIIKYMPDAVISFMNDTCAFTSFALYNLNIPLIYSERNDPNNVNQDLKNKIYRIIVENKTDGIVFQTKAAMNCYSKKLRKKSIVIPNPIDTSCFPKRDSKCLSKIIVNVGRLVNQKNHELLIKSFYEIHKKHPDYSLYIFGEGHLRPYLEKLILNLNLENFVFLKGNSNNIIDEIKNSRLFILTSNFEGIPNALLEAMCLGLPCISTDFSPGSVHEIINNGINGLIVPKNNENSLVLAINRLISDEKLSLSLGNEASKIKKRLNSHEIALRWLDFISRVIKEKRL